MTAVAHAAPGPADPDAVPRTPDDPDLQLARDPRAGAGRLMVLAGNRPDLRGVIADNPGCSPELRAWVSRMGGASAGSEYSSIIRFILPFSPSHCIHNIEASISEIFYYLPYLPILPYKQAHNRHSKF